MSSNHELAAIFLREAAFETGKKNKFLKIWNNYCFLVATIDPETPATFESEKIKDELLKSPYRILNRIKIHQECVLLSILKLWTLVKIKF